jgi:hypothetical protein
MLSALIHSGLRYPALLLAEQQVHKRSVTSGPLVLGGALLKFPTPTADRDRTVSRRSEPSSRTALTGEQPDPWDLLQPQDAMSRHRMLLHTFAWHRLYLHPLRGREESACYEDSKYFSLHPTDTCYAFVESLRGHKREDLIPRVYYPHAWFLLDFPRYYPLSIP